MAGQQTPATPPTGGKTRTQAKPAATQQATPPQPSATQAGPSLSGLTPEQAKEFHEQFKVTYTAFVGIAALVHLFVIASNPWF